MIVNNIIILYLWTIVHSLMVLVVLICAIYFVQTTLWLVIVSYLNVGMGLMTKGR